MIWYWCDGQEYNQIQSKLIEGILNQFQWWSDSLKWGD